MPGPGLIEDYIAALSAQLPHQVVEELAGGLDDTVQHYLARGLDPGAAVRAAIAEFGEPQVIIAGFTLVHPARHAARRLLAVGPAVGACWAVVLLTGHAWTWVVPIPARVAAGVALLAVIGLLAAAAAATRYRLAARAGTGGCIGIAVLDAALIAGTIAAAPSVTRAVIVALAASSARICFTAWNLRPLGRITRSR